MKNSYGSFKDISDVCEKFDLDCDYKNFIKEEFLEINEFLLKKLNKHLNNPGTFSSEASISERIIFPIIDEVAEQYDLLVWSQIRFDVDKSLNLAGIPDFILAPPLRGLKRFKYPIVCLGEAKRNDFDKGWGQVGAEMYAAQLANIERKIEDKNKNNEKFNDVDIKKSVKNIPIFGLVTDGKDWEFGIFVNDKITINKSKIVALGNLQKVFDSLNWLIKNAHQNMENLLSL